MGFNGIYDGIASGKRLQFANLKMAIETVDLPSYKTVISIVM